MMLIIQMSGNSDFEDKATRLFNRLNAVAQPGKIAKNKGEVAGKVASSQELMKIKEDIEGSDFQTRRKMRGLNDNLRKLEGTLVEENQNRAKMDETFTQTLMRLEKNMKTVISSVSKSFTQKQKKLQEKIDALIKSQRKDIQTKLLENQSLIEEMLRLQAKVQTIVDEVTSLRKSRLQLQQKITKQFNDQIRQLKRIFQSDVHDRQERQTRSILSLKTFYKQSMQRIYEEQRQRQENQKMLMVVVEQLINHIIQA